MSVRGPKCCACGRYKQIPESTSFASGTSASSTNNLFTYVNHALEYLTSQKKSREQQQRAQKIDLESEGRMLLEESQRSWEQLRRLLEASNTKSKEAGQGLRDSREVQLEKTAFLEQFAALQNFLVEEKLLEQRDGHRLIMNLRKFARIDLNNVVKADQLLQEIVSQVGRLLARRVSYKRSSPKYPLISVACSVFVTLLTVYLRTTIWNVFKKNTKRFFSWTKLLSLFGWVQNASEAIKQTEEAAKALEGKDRADIRKNGENMGVGAFISDGKIAVQINNQLFIGTPPSSDETDNQWEIKQLDDSSSKNEEDSTNDIKNKNTDEISSSKSMEPEDGKRPGDDDTCSSNFINIIEDRNPNPNHHKNTIYLPPSQSVYQDFSGQIAYPDSNSNFEIIPINERNSLNQDWTPVLTLVALIFSKFICKKKRMR